MKRLALGAIVLLPLLLAAPAVAAQEDPGEGGVVHFGRDAVVTGEQVGIVVVIGGDLDLSADAEMAVVINGTADLSGVDVGTLIVVDGVANLDATTEVAEVWLTNAELVRADGSVVSGGVRSAGEPGFAGRWLTRLVLALGFALLVTVVGLLGAALAPGALSRAARTLTDRPGGTALAALTVWLAIPLALVLVAVSFVGFPTAVVVWLLVLPLLALVGYTVTGLRVGQTILSRNEGQGRPFMAMFVGVLTLVVLGQVPVIGWLIGLVAVFAGGGAVASVAWRTIRGDRRPADTTAPILPA